MTGLARWLPLPLRVLVYKFLARTRISPTWVCLATMLRWGDSHDWKDSTVHQFGLSPMHFHTHICIRCHHRFTI